MSIIISDFLTNNDYESAIDYLVGKRRDLICFQVLSKDELKAYMKYAIKLSENAVNEMNSGFIKPSPFKDECEYCSYGGMCGFCKDTGLERNVSGVSKKTIIDAVEYANNGGEDNE